MTDTPDTPIDDEALDSISGAPPEPDDKPVVREAHDADTHDALAKDPHHEDAKLDIGLDESFPSSDPPAVTAPGHDEPAPSSGYDEEAEKARESGNV